MAAHPLPPPQWCAEVRQLVQESPVLSKSEQRLILFHLSGVCQRKKPPVNGIF